MNLNPETDLEKLDLNELKHILKDHALYNATNGKEGKQADLGSYIIENADFTGINLSSINARGSIFKRCSFVDCDMYGAYFNDSSIIESNFRNAVLIKVEFYGVNVIDTCFDNAKMSKVEFIEAELINTTFCNADLHSATISECVLTNVVFDGADFTGAAVTETKEDGTSWINVKGRDLVA
jgi:uncharacterized protein YjbI with pentapeptide repeats